VVDTLFREAKPAVGVRGVHLDLKGCPPTFARLLDLLNVIAAARYNAVLVEWEDQFPWTVDARFRSPTAYTPDQVRRFHGAAAGHGIEVIPLVTCLGHMETPLSLPEYAPLREVPHRSDVLNPLADGAGKLIAAMVDDVLALMPSVHHFHLGGDEAWTFGSHPDTKSYIAAHGKGALYLHHVEPILDRLIARGVRPILWHDMMVEWDGDALRRLAGKADLMFWSYSGHPDRQTWPKFAPADRHRLAEHGVRLWGAGCYKGADGPSADRPDLDRRQVNACGWAEVAQRERLTGVVATGWSRYSTHRVQNEPIDAALDSLVNVGAILHDGRPPEGGVEACIALLDRIGEGERFRACRDAMVALSEARRSGWAAVQALREHLGLTEHDPRRCGSGVERGLLKDLAAVIRGPAGQQVRRSLHDLIAPMWVEEYLAERLGPLEQEYERLAQAARTVDPHGWQADGMDG
jgi:hexosaminidase